MSDNDINKYINKFKNDSDGGQDGRYASFDYCFNYFQKFREDPENIISSDNLEESCLHLGFYLASWGMYKGRAILLQHSCHFLEKPLTKIAKFDKQIWETDANKYTQKNIELLLECGKQIRKSIDIKRVSDTLITKIMLGVFGNVPAYDTNFIKWMKKNDMGGTFNKTSLIRISEFYQKNKKDIDNLSQNTKTINFLNGNKTKKNYTKAKIIDMYGFMKGLEI